MKNKTIKNMMSIALLTSMSAAMLVGCKDNKEEKETQPAIETQQSTNATESATKNPNVEEKNDIPELSTQDNTEATEGTKTTIQIENEPSDKVFPLATSDEVKELENKIKESTKNKSVHMDISTASENITLGLKKTSENTIDLSNSLIYGQSKIKENRDDYNLFDLELYFDDNNSYFNNKTSGWKKDSSDLRPPYEVFYNIPANIAFTENAEIEFDEETKIYTVKENIGYLVSKHIILEQIILDGNLNVVPSDEIFEEYDSWCEKNNMFFSANKAIMTFKEDGTPVEFKIEAEQLTNLFKDVIVDVKYSDWGEIQVEIPNEVIENAKEIERK